MAIGLSESNVDYSLPISLIRQHCFCPRIPFYVECLGLRVTDRVWQRQGVSHHQRQQMLNKRRLLSRYDLDAGELRHNLLVKHDGLGIHGICDAAIFTPTEIVPLEFKMQSAQPVAAHQLQLLAYGLALGAQYGVTVRRGFILYGERGKTQLVNFSEDLQQRLLRIIAEIKAIQQRAVLPYSSATSAQCGQCEYLNFCADRDE